MSVILKILLVIATPLLATVCKDSVVYSSDSDSLSIKKTETYCDIEYWELSREKSDIRVEITFSSSQISYSEKDTLYLVNSKERLLCRTKSDTTRFNNRTSSVLFSGAGGGGNCNKHHVNYTSSRALSFNEQILLFKSNFLRLISFDKVKNEAIYRVDICYEYGSQHDCEQKEIMVDLSKEVLFETKKGSKLLIRLRLKDIKSSK